MRLRDRVKALLKKREQREPPAKREQSREPAQIRFDGRPVLIVLHEEPDTDALVASVLLNLKVLPEECVPGYRLVRAGERLSDEECEGKIVFHLDTGMRYRPPFDFDQHALRSKQVASSARLVADYFRLNRDAGVRALVKLATDTDNIVEMAPDSIHHVISALRFDPLMQEEDGEPRWGDIMSLAFMLLRAMYTRTNYLVGSRVRFRRFCEQHPNEGTFELKPSGVKVAMLKGRPQCRDEAWKQGSDVAAWSHIPDPAKPDQFYVGIALGRKSDVSLRPLVAALRKAEAEKRGTKIPRNIDLHQSGQLADKLGNRIPGFGPWYLHRLDGQRWPLILGGSRTHPLEDGEFTVLTWSEIKQITFDVLSGKKLFSKKRAHRLPNPKARGDEQGFDESFDISQKREVKKDRPAAQARQTEAA